VLSCTPSCPTCSEADVDTLTPGQARARADEARIYLAEMRRVEITDMNPQRVIGELESIVESLLEVVEGAL